MARWWSSSTSCSYSALSVLVLSLTGLWQNVHVCALNMSAMGPGPVIPSGSSSASGAQSSMSLSNAIMSPNSSTSGNSTSSSGSGTRLDFIKQLYGFQGFVYDIDSCPSTQDFQNDFPAMKKLGTTVVITFGVCQGKETDVSYYEDLISAADSAEVYIMPLVWTLSTDGKSFQDYALPIMNAVAQAVVNSPNAVLAVALGDEPLYDNDAGSPSALAKYITQLKSNFSSAGLDIPVSISDMAYGWQQAGSGASAVADVVDFFMINNFPYFDGAATTANNSKTWSDFTGDVSYFQGIAKGKPLLVTQTGWPENTQEFGPQHATSNLQNEEDYWNLLMGHCADYFKTNNLGWMWRSYGDNIVGWGVVDSSGKEKWQPSVTTC